MTPIADRETCALFRLLELTALFLWKDWPRDMKLSSTSERGFTLNGTCPHCGKEAAFPSVTVPFDEMAGYSFSEGDRKITALQCIACREYILGIIKLHYANRNQSYWWQYEAHFPLDKPNDNVSEDIPESIRLDFQEAVRCQWVKAYNATAEMCRRAVETSCIEQGVPEKIKNLEDMIDWLEEQRKITPALKDAAHKVRLGGNRGAHPPHNPEEKAAASLQTKGGGLVIRIEEEHAEAIVAFTQHFLDHIYVIPKQLPQYDFSKPKKKLP